jgi:hypothetical protein
MEYAISNFFGSGDHIVCKMREWLVSRFQESVADPQWHAQNFCRQLIAVNPLHIDAALHGGFWSTMHDRNREVSKGYPEDSGDYYVIVNGGEMLLRMTHSQALIVVLSTILSPLLRQRLLSVYNFPEHVLLAFLKRKEMRDMFFRNFAPCCEDRLDIYAYYNRGLITHEMLYSTLDEYNDEDGENCYITPPPEAQEIEPMEVDGAPLDIAKLVLPERVVQEEFVLPKENYIKSMLGFYTYLWSEVAKVVDAVQYQYKLAHGKNCKCHQKILDMRVLFPVLRAFVEQSLDSRTLARMPTRAFFSVAPVLAEKIELVATHISQHLRGAPTPPELDINLYNNARYSDTIKDLMQEQLGKRDHWSACTLTEIPLPLLLSQLDADYLFAGVIPRLRQFLANKPRELYIAYLLPKEVSLYDLRNTLHQITERFGRGFPSVNDIFPLRSLKGVYMVSRPASLTVLRCLMVSYRLMGATPARDEGFSLQLPQSYAALRNYLMCANENSTEINQAALYSLVSMILLYTSPAYQANRPGNSAHWTSLDSVSQPADGLSFSTYRHLPRVCEVLTSQNASIETQCQVLRGFVVRPRTGRRSCDAGTLRTFLYKIEQEILPDSPFFTLSRNLCSAYKSKDITGEVCISRRTTDERNYPAMYELLLATDCFMDDEVLDYLKAFSGQSPGKALGGNRSTRISFSADYIANPAGYAKKYTEAVKEFWPRSEFSNHVDSLAETFQRGVCNEQREVTEGLDFNTTKKHYEVSRFGHTFHTVHENDSLPVLQTEAKVSLIRLVVDFEHRFHGADDSPHVDPKQLLGWIHEEEPLCMPLSLQPAIYFENCFFVLVGRTWPLVSDDSLDSLASNEDLPSNNIRNMLDHVVENTDHWRPSLQATASVGGSAGYVLCMQTFQKTLALDS